MQIAIIGAGHVGTALANGWAKAGHHVHVGVRDPKDPKHREAGRNATLATIADAARAAEVVLLATPWPGTRDAVAACGDLGGKVVVDATNPFDETLAAVVAPPEGSAGQAVAAWAGGAHVVKAFNTTGAPNMAKALGYPAPLAMFLCGDDAAAKKAVASLVHDLDFEPIDVGPLAMSLSLEHLALVWVNLAIHKKLGVDIGYALVRRMPDV